jgi:L(+)-tartrate dehydratase beta subunit
MAFSREHVLCSRRHCVEEVEQSNGWTWACRKPFWVMRVKEFGPLIVSIDTKGNNLFEIIKEPFNHRKDCRI